MINLKSISTEQRNQATTNIDTCSVNEILHLINNEDKIVPKCIEEKIPAITCVVEKVVESLKKGGRLIYMGAGTSGRIGILDAVECPPTFGIDYEMVSCLMAGGDSAFVKAKEGAEDDKEAAIKDLLAKCLNANDIVIGIAASGRTPYVLSGVTYAKGIGATTACITTSLNTPLENAVDYPIVVYTGPEVITGSTRMKSGTAQKLVCNMISTASMIKMGKVYQNLMVDVKPTNEKLIARSISIIMTVLECSEEEAKSLFEKYHNVKKALFAGLTNIKDEDIINKSLNDSGGNLRKALSLMKK